MYINKVFRKIKQCNHSILVVIHADKNAKQNPFSLLVNKFLCIAKHRLHDRAAIIQQNAYTLYN